MSSHLLDAEKKRESKLSDSEIGMHLTWPLWSYDF